MIYNSLLLSILLASAACGNAPTQSVPASPPGTVPAADAMRAGFSESGQVADTSELAMPWLPTDVDARRQVLTGRINPATDTNFVVLDGAYTDTDGPYRVRRETSTALRAMIDAARRDNVTLQVKSATRNNERQAQIWGAKWRGERLLEGGLNLATSGLSDSAKARKILLYSSMPGTSRHHWGTDVDLNAFTNEYFATGKGAAEYAWLQAHGAEYGFYQPYTSKEGGRTGYEEERWHWSYRPLSKPLLDAYRRDVTYADISGFDGDATATKVGAIEKYVLGINPELL